MSDASSQKLKLVFVSTEVTPWSKVGGLGDVIGALPVAMAARGHSVMTVAPRYAEYKDAIDTGIQAPIELPPTAQHPQASPANAAQPTEGQAVAEHQSPDALHDSFDSTGHHSSLDRISSFDRRSSFEGRSSSCDHGGSLNRRTSSERRVSFDNQAGAAAVAAAAFASHSHDVDAIAAAADAEAFHTSLLRPPSWDEKSRSPLTHRASREAHGSLGSGQWPALGSAEALSSPRSSLQEALAAGGMQDAGGDGAPGSHSQPSGAANSLMSPFVRYFWVRQDGVDRVFVDHPCYADTTDIYGTGNVNTYVESGEFPDLDLRYSILCQAALAAPHLLWPRKQAHVDAVLQGSASQGVAAGMAMPMDTTDAAGMPAQAEQAAAAADAAQAAERSQQQATKQAGAGTPAASHTAHHISHHASEHVGGSHSQLHRHADTGNGVVFIGNDWPCSPLALRLKHCICPAQHSAAQPAGLDHPAAGPTTAVMPAAVTAPPTAAASAPIDMASPASRAAKAALMEEQQQQQQQMQSAACADRRAADEAAGQACLDPQAFAAQLSAGLQGSRVAFCIHNLAYQGTYPLEAFKRLCLPQRALPALLWPPVPGVGLEQQEALRGAGGMVYAGEACEVAPHEPPSLNWMHAALSESDAVFTVSPNYAQEIRLDPDMACQMQDLLQRKGVRGIMNGIDTTEWDPATDPHLPEVARYTPATAVLGKAAAKAVLQAKFGLLQALDVPLIGLIGRLTEQKGVDVVLSAVPALLGPARRAALAATYGAGPNPALSTAPEMQMVMLGTGEAWMEAALEGLQASFPGSAVGLTYFDEAAAHLIMAASDFILVPSRFEPCGLVAECAVRYGAVPIVAPVGGLKDLVTPEVGYLTERIGDKRDPNQHRIAVASLYSTVMQAVKEYGTPRFQQLQQNCMALDVSWDKPAAEWEQALLQMMQQQ